MPCPLQYRRLIAVLYGETPPGITPPTDTAVAGGTYSYNGAQGKLTEGNLTFMGARPYLVNRYLHALHNTEAAGIVETAGKGFGVR